MDIAIVIIYLATVLIVGIRRGYRTKSIRDFAVGDRKVGVLMLVTTISATYIGGGSTLGISERIFRTGVIFAIIGMLCNIIYKATITYLIIPRVALLKDSISMGEAMGVLYGRGAQVLTGLFGCIRCLGNLSSQIASLGLIFQFFFGGSFVWAVFIGAGIVVLYTSFGGIRSVIATDFFQFSILTLGIAVVFSFVLIKVGGYEGLWQKLPHSHKMVFSEQSLLIDHLFLLIIFSAPFLDPSQFQCLLICKDSKKTRKAMFMAMTMDVVIFFMIGIIGLSSIVLFPDGEGSIAILNIVQGCIQSSIWRGICISGLVAVVMSTADSYLGSATLALVNDLMIPMSTNFVAKKVEILVLRIVTLVLGFSSVIVVLYFDSIIDIVISFISFWGTFMFVPFFAGLFGLGASSRSFWASTCFGIPTFLAWSYLFQSSSGLPALFPGLCASAVAFFSVYFYEQEFSNFWQRIKFTGSSNDSIFSWGFYKNWVLNSSREEMAIVANISNYHYYWISLFCVVNYLIPFLVLTPINDPFFNIKVFLRLVSGILCLLLIFNNYWPENLKKYRSCIWYLTLYYSLSFLPILMFFSHDPPVIWLLSMCFSIFILAIVTKWEYFIFIFLSGVVGAVFTSYLVFNGIFVDNFWSFGYFVASSLIFGLVFCRKKDRSHQDKVASLRAFSATIAHEMRIPLTSMRVTGDYLQLHLGELINHYQAHSGKQIPPRILALLQEAPGSLSRIGTRNLAVLDALLTNLRGPRNLHNFKTCSIQACINLALSEYPFEGRQRARISVNSDKDFIFVGDENLTMHVLFNLLGNSINQIKKNGSGTIQICTEIQAEQNRLVFQDDAGGIPVHLVDSLFSPFFSHDKQQGTGVGLSFCHDVMNRFGGDILCQSDGKTITTFIMVFPTFKKR